MLCYKKQMANLEGELKNLKERLDESKNETNQMVAELHETKDLVNAGLSPTKEENSKRAIDGLASALREVATEASVAKSFDYHEKELESEEGLQGMYDRWRSHHKVGQQSPDRFNVFKTNVKHVHNTNKMNKPYKLKLNKFADLTNRERISMYSDSKIGHNYALMGPRKRNLTFIYADATNIPPKMDWRLHNAVTPVKNQGQCGTLFFLLSIYFWFIHLLYMEKVSH
nr:putative peptidase C1A [Tanacetum cinerariifolium]